MLRPADRGALSPRHRTDPRSAGGRVRSDVGLLMAFWAFFSIFPLRFIFVTLLGYVLPVGAELVIQGGDLRHHRLVLVGHDRRSWGHDCRI
jgi:hypothetical protein